MKLTGVFERLCECARCVWVVTGCKGEWEVCANCLIYWARHSHSVPGTLVCVFMSVLISKHFHFSLSLSLFFFLPFFSFYFRLFSLPHILWLCDKRVVWGQGTVYRGSSTNEIQVDFLTHSKGILISAGREWRACCGRHFGFSFEVLIEKSS